LNASVKIRKWMVALLAGTLVTGIVGTAFAAETVPGSVYGTAPASDALILQAQQQIQQQNPTASPAQVQLQVQAVVTQIITQQLATVGVKDVPATNYAAASIVSLVQAGVMTPNSQGQINPNAPTTVDSATAVFAKVLGVANKTDDDVTAAKKAEQAGLLDNRTDIQRDMTRLETAKLLARALGIEPKANVTAASFPFADITNVPQDQWGLLAALYDAGVFKGFEDKTFRPDSILTKAQIAVLVDRVLRIRGL